MSDKIFLEIPEMINKKHAGLADYLKGFGCCTVKFAEEYGVPDEWQVKPAEPVVLSAEEIIKKVKSETINTSLFDTESVTDAIKIADINGQVKRQRALQSLIVAAKAYVKMDNNALQLKHCLKNIPPIGDHG